MKMTLYRLLPPGSRPTALAALFCLALLPLLSAQPLNGRVRLLFAGDVMGHLPQINAAEIKKNELYDFTPCFKYVKPVIAQADLAIANLEVTLPGKPPYQGYPMFRSPDDLALALRDAGFDMLVTANNHSNDGGKDGIYHTIDVLREYGLLQTGTFKNPEERNALYPLVVYKNNLRLAFLNYTYGTNGVRTPEPAIVNVIDSTLIEKELQAARQLNADAIIVVMHWGLEYQLQENAEQRRLALNMLRWGADLVIGSHPHVVQPVREETVRMSNGTTKKGYVAYSLGNFISAQNKPHTDGGLIFEIEARKEADGRVAFVNPRYIPVWRHIHKDAQGKNHFYAIPVSPFEKGASYANAPGLTPANRQAMDRFAQATRERLNKSNCPERLVTLLELGLLPAASSTR